MCSWFGPPSSTKQFKGLDCLSHISIEEWASFFLQVARVVTVVAGRATSIVINAPLATNISITAPFATRMAVDASSADTVLIICPKVHAQTVWRKHDTQLVVNGIAIKQPSRAEAALKTSVLVLATGFSLVGWNHMLGQK